MKKILLFLIVIINLISFSFFVYAADVEIKTNTSLTPSGDDNYAVSSGNTLTATGNNYTYSKTISGAGNLAIDKDALLYLTGSNTLTGTVTIDGNLRLSSTATLDSLDIRVNNQGRLILYDKDFNNSDRIIQISGQDSNQTNGAIWLVNGGGDNAAFNNSTIQLNADSYIATSKDLTFTLRDDNSDTVIVNSSADKNYNLYLRSYNGAGTFQIDDKIDLNSGTLNILTNTTLNAGVVDMVDNATSVDVTGTYNLNFNDTINGLSGTGTVSTSTVGAKTLTVGSSNSSSSFSGVIEDGSGSINLIKAGSGTLTLSGTNTYTGSTTINAGTIDVSGQLNSGNYAGAIANSGTFTFSSDSNQILSGDISGTGALTKSGSSILTLSGTNTYTGSTTINAGTLKITGALSNLTDLIIASDATLDLQISQQFSSIDLNGTISRTTGTSSLNISGTSDLGGNVTTSGTQTYTGATTLSASNTLTTSNANISFGSTINSDGTARNLTINSGTGITQFAGIVGGTNGVGDIDITGALDLNASISNASSLTVSGTSNIGADVTTTGTQVYSGATTFSNSSTLTASTVNFGSTVDGGNNLIVVSGNADIDGAITNANAFSVSGVGATSDIGADITTAGVQFLGNATLSGTGDRTVTSTGGSNITFYGITGASKGLTVDGGFQLSTNDATGLASLSVTGASTLAADVTSTGTQSYDGTTTLSSGDRTLTASTVTLNAVTGGSNALTVTGNLDLDGAVSGVTNMSVSGTSNIGSNVTTTGTQNYQGTTTLSGGDRTLEGSTITMAAVTGTGSHDLTVTGNLDLDGAVTNVVELDITGTSNLGANVTTSGTQNYQGTTTLSGGDRILQGSTITLAAVTGGSNALTVTGNLDLDGAVSGVTNMSVSGTSNIGADVTTTGTQSYTGTTTVSASSTLIGTEISAAAIALNDDLEIRNSSDSTLTSVISGTGALTKSGSGALTLRGINTFDGDLTVSAGTLFAGLAADSGNQVIENNVTVSGGTLSGGATIGGNVTVATANLAPGNSIGTLTIDGNVTLGDNSTTTIEFNDTTSDKVVVSGNITLAGALVLEPANTTYSDVTLTIFDGSGGSGNSLSGTFASTTVNNSSNLGDATTSISYDTVNRKVFLNIDEDGGVSSNTVKSLTTKNNFKDIAEVFDAATTGKTLEVANVLKASDSNSVNTELGKLKGTVLATTFTQPTLNHNNFNRALSSVTSSNVNTSLVSSFTSSSNELTLASLQDAGL
jgi:autotransporter-associated beta strand protein